MLKYSIIYADPAWRYQDKNCNGACAQHYKTMPLKEICDLPIKEMADEDCVLFLWATFPLLPDALQVMQAWGFKYKSVAFVWVKKNKSGRGFFYGLGRWTRGNAEICLLGVKGKPQRERADVSQLVVEELKGHSQKPHEVRERIVKSMGNKPRIELFARCRVEGWDSWGNEIDKFEEIKNNQKKLCDVE